MAARMDVTQVGSVRSGAGPAGGEEAEPHRTRATGWPAGPDLLVWAAAVLPVVVGRGPVRCADVHTALYEAACGRRMGRDRPHRLRLADEALALFAAYLVISGQTRAIGRDTDTVWEWLVGPHRRSCPSLAETQLVLAAAAGYWRRQLETGTFAGYARQIGPTRRAGGQGMVWHCSAQDGQEPTEP